MTGGADRTAGSLSTTARVNRPRLVPRGRHAPPLEVRLEVQRERLFEAAADRVRRAGYAEASAEAISREAGMSKATFYEHFANKEECILALFDESAERARAADGAGDGPGRRRRPRRRSAPAARAFLRRSPSDPSAPRRCWSRSSAPARARSSAATRCSSASPTLVEAENAAAPPQARRAALRLAATTRSRSWARRRACLAPAAHRQARRHHASSSRSSSASPGSSSRLAAMTARCADLEARDHDLPGVPAAGRVARGGRARSSGRRSPTRSTGAGRSRASATRPRACCCSAWRPPPTAPTAPGRVFTGDRSGDFLFAALHRTGLRQPADVGLAPTTGCELTGAWITAAVRCAPPANKPTPDERDRCLPWTRAPSSSCCPTCASSSASARSPGTPRCGSLGAPAAGRGRASATRAEAQVGGWTLLGCFHPQPAEHVHRQADRADDRRGVPARTRADVLPRPRRMPVELDALASFSPRVRDWFDPRSPRRRAAQEQAWPAIASGEHVLICRADRLGQDARGVPVGARQALAGAAASGATRARLRLAAEGARLRHRAQPARAAARHRRRTSRSAIRTGDTPQRERAAMRRKPPDILITTPESLYLMLTSQAREMLTRRGGGDRRRDPRGRVDQARLASGADAGAARAASSSTRSSASA